MHSIQTIAMNQRLFQNIHKQVFRRFYSTSTEGTILQTMTKESTKEGWKILEKINITKTWSTMSGTQKTVLGTYLGVASTEFLFVTYNDGKSKLLQYRSSSRAKTPKTQSEIDSEEWFVVKKGCGENLGTNFLKSIFFPFTAVADFMPQVVLFANREVKKAE